MPDTKVSDCYVKLDDVLKLVEGVAPPDGYYHAMDSRAVEIWTRAVARVAAELRTYLVEEVDD